MAALQNNDQYVGELLVKDGIISSEDLRRGLEEQKSNKDFLCATLVRLGFASEEKIFSILSLQIGVPYLNLKDFKIEPAALKAFPGSFALACKCIPVKIVDDCLFVALTDPLNSKAVEEIRSYAGVDKLKIFLSGENDVRDTIKKYYGLQ